MAQPVSSSPQSTALPVATGEIILGAATILLAAIATPFILLIIGIVLAIRGILDIWQATRSDQNRISGRMMTGLLSLGIGVLLLIWPGVGISVLSLILAGLFIFGGLYKLVAPWIERWPHAGWAALTGAVSLLLGLLIIAWWPVTSAFLLGLLVGTEIVLNGVSTTIVGTTTRRLAGKPGAQSGG